MWVLGIVQLVGLNLGGIFWLFWSKGIAEKKQSSRRWILIVHSIYLALACWALIDWISNSGNESYLWVFGENVPVGRFVVLTFIIILAVVFALPVFWLMKKNVSVEFNKMESNQGMDLTRDDAG